MKSSPRLQAGFTLVELMVSTAIIGLIMLVLVAMTNQTSQTWRSATEKIEKFQTARDGFEAMTRKLAQATLNTNWDYLDVSGKVRDKTVGSSAFNSFVPVYYGRVSDLRFVSGPMSANAVFSGLSIDRYRPGHGVFFQAPFGVEAAEIMSKPGSLPYTTLSSTFGDSARTMDNLLNTWGYFVEAGYDTATPQFVNSTNVPRRWRTRLMELMQPTEQMALYDPTDTTYKWFTTALQSTSNRPVRVMAENILTLIILPKLSKADEDRRAITQNPDAAMLSPEYIYDSFPTINGQPMPSPLNPGAKGGTDPGAINPKNQLPPILNVTMIALDERSAERLADKYCNGAVESSPTLSQAVMGLDAEAAKVSSPSVTYSTLFTDASRLEDDPNTTQPGDGDISDLERVLTHAGVTYRVFTSNVSIRGAKWSRVQTK